MNNDFNIDAFSEAMNNFIKENHIQVLLDMPEGTQRVKLESNVGELGPAVYFYILIQGLITTFREFRDILDPNLEGEWIDELLAEVKKEVIRKEE